MNDDIKAGLIQMNSGAHLDQNLESASKLARKAALDGADVILFPENFAFLGEESLKVKQCADIESSVFSFLSNLSKDLKVWALGGGSPQLSPDPTRVYNKAELFNPLGLSVAQYQKLHLFDAPDLPLVNLMESRTVAPGKTCVVAPLMSSWQMGLSICYDVRFAALYQKLTQMGAHILAIPAAFTVPTGKAHWHTLLKARAIENQSYVLAPAQTGLHGGKRASFGHSLAVDPWGEVLSDGGEEVGYQVVSLSFSKLAEVRQKMPLHLHRRFQVDLL